MSNKPTQWYLKKKNNTQYGPVSLAEMALWAQQCRIVAGNQASTNQQDWIPVEDIPELAMEWLALRKDGKRYGPFPLSAVPELLKHQVLPEDASLTHAVTGETMSIADARATLTDTPTTPHTQNQNDPPQQHTTSDAPETTPTKKETAAHQPNTEHQREKTPISLPAADEHHTDAYQMQIAELLKDREDRERATTRQVEALQAELEQVRDERETLAAQARTLKQQAREKQQAHETQINTLQDERDQARGASGKLQTHAETHASNVAELRQQVAFMKKNIAALNAQLLTARQTAAQRARMLTIAWFVVTALTAGLIVMLLARGCQRERPSRQPPAKQHTDAADTAEPLPPITNQHQDTQPERTQSTTEPPTDLRVQIPGISVTRQNEATSILHFNESIFSSLDTLSPEGRQLLDALARQLPRNLDGWEMIIHGHTDNIPMRSTTRFADNTALALARAETVAQHFVRRASFPERGIKPQAGTTAPFPNDTPENRKRNRTVTIELKPINDN